MRQEEIRFDSSIYEFDSNIDTYTDEGLFDKCCKILGLSNEGFSINEYKSSYKKLAMKYHPDKNSGKALSEQQEAEKIFKAIAFAYENINRFVDQNKIERLFIGNRVKSQNAEGSVVITSFYGFENIFRENIHEYISRNIETLMENAKFSIELSDKIRGFGLSKEEKDFLLQNVIEEITKKKEEAEILHIANKNNWGQGTCLRKFAEIFGINHEDLSSNFFDKLARTCKQNKESLETVQSNDFIEDLNKHLTSTDPVSRSSFLSKLLSCGPSRSTEGDRESLHALHRILRQCSSSSPQSKCLAQVNDLSNGRLNREEVKKVLIAINQELSTDGTDYSDLKANFEKKFKDSGSISQGKVKNFLSKAFSQYEQKRTGGVVAYSGR